MSSSISLKFVFAFVFFAGSGLMAQEGNGVALLRHTAETYKGLRSESLEANVVMDMKTYRIETPIAESLVRPGKVRFEVINSMMGSQTISDGRNVWKYVPSFGQYTRTPATSGVLPIADGPAEILSGERVLEGLRSATVLRREELTVDGSQVDCDVIDAAYAPEQRRTYWVDSRRGLILKLASVVKLDVAGRGERREVSQTVTVTSVQVNTALQASLFVFVPPSGAKEVAELTPPGGKSSNGHKVAPERE